MVSLVILITLKAATGIFWDKQGTTQIISEQNVRQQDWSHRFHYGFDYRLK